MSLFEELTHVFKEEMRITSSDVTAESRLEEDLGFDSLDLVEVVMKLEAVTGVEIPDEAAGNLRTVADVLSFLEQNGVETLGV